MHMTAQEMWRCTMTHFTPMHPLWRRGVIESIVYQDQERIISFDLGLTRGVSEILIDMPAQTVGIVYAERPGLQYKVRGCLGLKAILIKYAPITAEAIAFKDEYYRA